MVPYAISHLGHVATLVISTAGLASLPTTNVWVCGLELFSMMALIVRVTKVIKVVSEHSAVFHLRMYTP